MKAVDRFFYRGGTVPAISIAGGLFALAYKSPEPGIDGTEKSERPEHSGNKTLSLGVFLACII